jgi:sphinganine-1-phosphate aldolase
VIDEYIADLRDAVAYVRSHPEVADRGNAAMYGMMAKVPFRGMVRQGVMNVMRNMYGPNALDFDPAKLNGEGVVDKVMNAVGPTLNKVLDRVEALKERFR